MYSNKLAVALKSAGKVLREFKDQVYVPFGTEYSILIKNLNSVRASVKVSVDGQDATDGTSLIINPNSELELERFIRNSNLNEGNRFKFIERTNKIEENRGIGVEDGLVRVEFQFEKTLDLEKLKEEFEKMKKEVHHHYHHHYDRYVWPYRDPYNPHYPWYTCGSSSTENMVGDKVKTRGLLDGVHGTITSAQSFNTGSASVVNDAGITVPGSKSEQKFTIVKDFPLETEKHVIVLRILGETQQGKQVQQAITVKAKQKCSTCGHINKATSKFCTECGTALELL